MEERFEQQRDQFERALARLHEALPENETPIVRDALIQRFEFTFEMAWRSLHRYLAAKGVKVPQQAWAVLPLAFQSQLIENAELWDQVREYRNLTSHTYQEDMAIRVAAFIRAEAVAAFDALAERLRKP
jgi:nucleotidyltransferase substrate binding protein (TIGR01987 family)